MTFIDARSKVLRHIDRIAAWDRGETPAPVTVEWDLSNRCVLGCHDCHFAHTHVKGPWATKPRLLPMAFDGTGDLADIDLVTRGLFELKRAGVQSVIWSGGGEPTTHPGWRDALMAAEAAGLQQGMYTLGGLLSAEDGPFAASLLEWVVVSLDCADAESYSREKGVPASRFEAACDGVRALVGHKAVVGVSFLLHAGNWNKCVQMADLARSLGATYTTFRPAIRTDADYPSVCDDDRSWVERALDPRFPTVLQLVASRPDVEIDLDRFRAYAEWTDHGYRDCHGIQLNTTISPDGRVWICPQRRGVTALGDLRVESFASIWARHPRTFTVDQGCRVMCRLHPVNETLASLRAPRAHEAFV